MKITVEVEKKDYYRQQLKSPYYSVFKHPLVDKCGRYRGGFNDEWVWDHDKLDKLTEDEMEELCKVCIESWK
jgi:hypothetical protein